MFHYANVVPVRIKLYIYIHVCINISRCWKVHVSISFPKSNNQVLDFVGKSFSSAPPHCMFAYVYVYVCVCVHVYEYMLKSNWLLKVITLKVNYFVSWRSDDCKSLPSSLKICTLITFIFTDAFKLLFTLCVMHFFT